MALLRFQLARLRVPFGNSCKSLLISLLAISIGAWSGCAPKKAPRNARVPVKVASTAEQPMPFVLTSIGTVEALRTASVGSQVGGVVTKIFFREGDVVRAGQVLIQLDHSTEIRQIDTIHLSKPDNNDNMLQSHLQVIYHN